jgi:DNA-binding transcriptional ArsR family regulator
MRKQTDPIVLLLQAAADPTRLAIIRQLSSDGQVCACGFTACCEVAQPTVAHHLRVLCEVGWVEGERRSTWIWCSLRPQATARLQQLAGQITPGSARPAEAFGSTPGALPGVQPN